VQDVQREILDLGAGVLALGGAPSGGGGQPDSFGALARLLAGRGPDEGGRDEEALSRLRLEIEVGLLEDAAATLNAWPDRAIDPATKDRLVLSLAKAWIGRGDLDRAAAELPRVAATAGSDTYAERILLQARILMTRNHPVEAASLLEGVETPPDWAAYARFNRAMALDRAGRRDAAMTVLDALGRATAADAEILALRDKANIVLGFMRLAQQQPGPAKEAFNRVRFEGPFSAQALYGLGWSDFERADYARAMIPWSELRRRGATDRTVQEVWLLIPYAQWRLGAYRDAVRGYREANGVFEREARRLRDVDAEAGRLLPVLAVVSAARRSGSHVALPAGYDLERLFDDHLADEPLAQALDTYRELQDQRRRLDGWAAFIQGKGDQAGDLQSRLTAARSHLEQVLMEQEAFLRAAVRQQLERQRDRAERFERRASEELARLLDAIGAGAGDQ
jgi:hypothetical protein